MAGPFCSGKTLSFILFIGALAIILHYQVIPKEDFKVCGTETSVCEHKNKYYYGNDIIGLWRKALNSTNQGGNSSSVINLNFAGKY